MTRVACIMMQRDETLLLEPWLRYHGYLFGFENIFVFDNGSVEAEVKLKLALFESAGVNVDYSKSSPADFEHKGQVVGSLIREFELNDRYDIVLPLDCDEFVAVIDNQGFSIRRDAISNCLEELSKEKSIVKVGHCLDNRPGFLDLFRLTSFEKTIIPVGDFKDVDHGFHQARAKKTTDYRLCNIIYIHLHFKPFELVKQHALAKLRPFVDIESDAALRSFSGVGKHLVRFFLMSEVDYFTDLAEYRYPLVNYSGFRQFLSVLMDMKAFETQWLRRPTMSIEDLSTLSKREVVNMSNGFDVLAYEERHPDVARSSLNSVVHYCLFGFREKRPIKSE